jgi:hypothetical protein
MLTPALSRVTRDAVRKLSTKNATSSGQAHLNHGFQRCTGVDEGSKESVTQPRKLLSVGGSGDR